MWIEQCRLRTAPRRQSLFQCRQCGEWCSCVELNLDLNESPVCTACYLEDPPPEDIDGVFAEVMAHLEELP